jgi:hypothetical protein
MFSGSCPHLIGFLDVAQLLVAALHGIDPADQKLALLAGALPWRLKIAVS